MCIATMTLNQETCTCEPIKLPPTGDFVCTDEGTKECLDDPELVSCERGWFDEEICGCRQAACRIGCPAGQQLDPREFCKCVPNEVVKELSTCEPPCTLTDDQCPGPQFTVNKDTCQCECNLTCGANQYLDQRSCSCKTSTYYSYWQQ